MLALGRVMTYHIRVQALSRVLDKADVFCIEGVCSSDASGKAHDIQMMLAEYEADRSEGQTLVDVPPQVCFRCFRTRDQLWVPGNRSFDYWDGCPGKFPCARCKTELMKDIETAKTSGTWRELPGQPGPSFPPTKFWDAEKLTAMPLCKNKLEECLRSLRITQLSLEGNALMSLPVFDPLRQVCCSRLNI